MTFDQHSTEFAEKWPEIYAQLRQECPVSWTDAHGGFYVVTRHADIRRVAQDFGSFSSENDVDGSGNGGQGIQIPPQPVRLGPLEMDPPRSLEYRRLLTSLFSQKVCNAYEPRLREIAAACIDRTMPSGSLDVVADVGNPVAALSTLEIAGLPLAHAGRYGDILHRSIYTDRESPGWAQVATDVGWVAGDLLECVRDRRRTLADDTSRRDGTDVLGALLAAQVGGVPLSDEEVAEILFMLCAGGFDTTASLLANAVAHLDQNASDRDALVASPEMIPTAVEELLRYYGPSAGIARTVVTPAEVGGTSVAPGDRVWMAWGSGNRDELVFPDAERFILDREPNPHLSFGHGAHKCIGLHLARMSVRVALEELLTRVPEHSVTRDGVRRYDTVGVINGFVTLPIEFASQDPTGGWDPLILAALA